MERKVVKYPLPLTNDGPEIDTDTIEVIMPRGAKILRARMVDGRAAIWALVNPERQRMARHIEMVQTNAPMGKAAMGTYIDSLPLKDGVVITHLFDLGEREWEMPAR